MFGILNAAKPVGMTSRDLVNVVQRRIRPVKVGHAGTLDPLASGVLLLPVGPAVRLTNYLQELPKTYAATFRLGCETPSGDLESTPTVLADAPEPAIDDIRNAANSLTGRIEQVPPAHSAIHIDGKRAYQLVREGKSVEMKPRTVDVYAFEIVRYAYPDVEVRIVCGSGTYVRSLGIDLAGNCGTVAVMTSLVRTAIGPFTLDQACSIEALRTDELEPHLSSPLLGLPHLPQVTLSGEVLRRVTQGQIVDLPDVPPMPADDRDPEIAAIDEQNRLRALLIPKAGGWRSHRGFPLPEG